MLKALWRRLIGRRARSVEDIEEECRLLVVKAAMQHGNVTAELCDGTLTIYNEKKETVLSKSFTAD
jgi:hypothetical protein